MSVVTVILAVLIIDFANPPYEVVILLEPLDQKL